MDNVMLVLLVFLVVLLLLCAAALAIALIWMSRRVSMIERYQGQISHEISTVGSRLVETDSIAKTLAGTATSIQTELARTQEGVVALQAAARARQDMERQTSESIRRLEAVIAGTQTKGAAGENIVEVVFAQLPADWQVRGFRVGDRVVEFGLRLPNNLVLPIDSKWTATNLLEKFLATDDIEEQRRLKSEIERAVLGKAREVRKYIDPNVTSDFGIVAVPDAVYDLCSGVQAETFQMNVVLISYSMFLPYLLLVFQMILKTSRSIDLQRLNSYLESVQASLDALQGELEGRFSRAITMLTNSRDDSRVHLSKIKGGLTSLQLGAGSSPEMPQPEQDAAYR